MVFGSILKRINRGTLVFTGTVIKWGLIAHVATEYIGCIIICAGESMEPTLSHGNILISDQLTPRFGSLNRGDIIICRSPIKPKEFICKRVLAVSGDVLACNRLDGTVAAMPVVPRAHIWIEGDNSEKSQDSRHYGPIPLGLVQGKVLFRLWPPRLTFHHGFVDRLKGLTTNDTK